MTDPLPSPPRTSLGRIAPRTWFTLLAIVGASLLFQYFMFRGFVEREVAPEPPRNHDQAGYLVETYSAYESILHEGFATAVARDFRRRRPNGLLIPLEAALLLLVSGPSRVGALTLNFLYFGLFQAVLAATLLWWSRRLSFALFGVGLLLLVRSPHFWAGGLADFRFDFVAFCCWGIFLAFVLRSGYFRSAAWSCAAGVTAAFLVLQRFLTVTYVAGTLGLFLCGLVLALVGRSSRRDLHLARIRGVLFALVPIVLLVGPAVWYCRDTLWRYYVVGHFSGGGGSAGARAVEIVRSLGTVAAFYPITIVKTHPGPFWGAVVLLTLAVSLRPYRSSLVAMAKDESLRTGLLFFLTAFMVPLAILTADPDKSPVVGSILVPPLTFGLLWLVGIRSGLLDPAPANAVLRSWRVGSASVFALGLLFQAYSFGILGGRGTQKRPEVVRLHDRAILALRRAGLARVVVFSDRMTDDSFDHSTLAVTVYERHGIHLDASSALSGNHAISPAMALEALERSDLALLTDTERSSSWHSRDNSVRRASSALHTFCASRYRFAGHFLLSERSATLWVRWPEAPQEAFPVPLPSSGASGVSTGHGPSTTAR